MPHPLPEDIDSVSGLKWFLAAVPDDPAFTRAAWDVFTELANYWKWGKEGPVPDDSDKAAQLWSTAVYETIEAYKMGFPDVLLGHIDEVEDLLRSLQAIDQITAQCCDNLGPLNETAETDLEPGGTPPATWGDETVADADDWEQLVCGAAHAYVDYLKAMATELETFVTLGAIAIGGIASLLSIGAGAGILLTISYGAAATVVSGLIASATVGLFGDVPDDLEAARADIVCEIVHGDVPGMAAAIEASMSALAWSLFYQYVDYASARNIMLEGDHGEETLGVNRRTDCDCAVGSVFYNFTDFGTSFDGLGIWSVQNSTDLEGDRVRIDTPNGRIVLSNQSWGGPVDITFRALVQIGTAGRQVTLDVEGQTLVVDTVGNDWYELTVSSANSSPYTLSATSTGDGPAYVAQAEIIVDPS